VERVACALLLALPGCAPAPRTSLAQPVSAAEVQSAVAPQGFARADAPRTFDFPADHGVHERFQSEWWYVTGHLSTPTGERFGCQVTFFRRALRPPQAPSTGSAWECDAIWMAHLALLEIESGRFHAAERFEREALGLAGARGDPLTLRVADWSFEGTPSDLFPLRVRAGEGELALELELAPTKPLVLHGQGGWSRKGSDPGNSSYYYSATRLSTRGTLHVGGREREVSGSSWLDREWSTSVLDEGQVGWDWFALQLDDGRELMLYLLRGKDGEAAPQSSGTLVARDGGTRTLARADFEIDVLDRWTSPESGATYPARWRLRVPSQDLDLELSPYAADAELRLTLRYWEGPAEVRDRARGGAAVGRAYVELVGYGERR
jgi:predicted secreted hydrolase